MGKGKLKSIYETELHQFHDILNNQSKKIDIPGKEITKVREFMSLEMHQSIFYFYLLTLPLTTEGGK